MNERKPIKNRSLYYPIFLNVRGKKCIVVGGGEVAERKAKGLLESGAHVTVISPSLTRGLIKMEERGEIDAVRRNFRPTDMRDSLIAIAATDNEEVNNSIVRKGAARRVLVNVVDKAIDSDFILPSIVRRSDIIIAISTSGRSPALARKLRAELENYLEQLQKHHQQDLNVLGKIFLVLFQEL